MDNDKTDEIEELRERVEELQAETRRVWADYLEGLCRIEDVELALGNMADVTNELRCELLPIM